MEVPPASATLFLSTEKALALTDYTALAQR